MPKTTIDRLIINSPYEEPKLYWSYDRETRLFDLKEGRRPAGYVRASEHSKTFDDPGIFILETHLCPSLFIRQFTMHWVCPVIHYRPSGLNLKNP